MARDAPHLRTNTDRLGLERLRGACEQTTRVGITRAHPTDELRVQFDQVTISPAYRVLAEAYGAVLEAWATAKPALPQFTGARSTPSVVKRRCNAAVRGFDPRCSLRDAAQTAFAVWTLREVGWNVLEQASTTPSPTSGS